MLTSPKLKIVILSGASSIHTIRWANGLNAAGHEVHVISQHLPCDTFDKEVFFYKFPFRGSLGYFTMVPAVKKLLKKLQPDIVNAHYASGYATTARLVGKRPWLLSVWGSDVYAFPYKSVFHMWLVRNNLLAADAVASTSHCMAEQTRKLAPGLSRIFITPFGVDMASFESVAVRETARDFITVGTVKTMAATYGIDILIKAFALLIEKLDARGFAGAKDLQLRLVGGGEQAQYKNLAAQLGIASKVTFIGRVPHNKVPHELAELDIYVALSRQESFGVAVIEAGAAGRPVVVSNVGGLPEVTLQGKTGFIVAAEDPQAAADAMLQLVLDPEMRIRFGAAARQHVSKNYSWPSCVQHMVDIFNQLLSR